MWTPETNMFSFVFILVLLTQSGHCTAIKDVELSRFKKWTTQNNDQKRMQRVRVEQQRKKKNSWKPLYSVVSFFALPLPVSFRCTQHNTHPPTTHACANAPRLKKEKVKNVLKKTHKKRIARKKTRNSNTLVVFLIVVFITTYHFALALLAAILGQGIVFCFFFLLLWFGLNSFITGKWIWYTRKRDEQNYCVFFTMKNEAKELSCCVLWSGPFFLHRFFWGKEKNYAIKWSELFKKWSMLCLW